MLIEDGIIRDANTWAHNYLGWKVGELQGVPLASLLAATPSLDVPLDWDDTVAKTQQGPAPLRVRCGLLRGDASVLDTQLDVVSSVRASGTQSLVLVSQPGAGAVQKAHRMELLGKLAGGIAHDFNNLLTAIEGHLDEALDEEGTGAERRKHLRIATSCCQRASSLSRRLLDLSRDRTYSPRRVQVDEVIRGMQPFLQPILGANVRLELQTEPDLPEIAADPAQLEQLVLNLALNARDAMSGSGQLTISTRCQEVDQPFREQHPWAKPGSYVRLEIQDTGIGIPYEDQPHVFEPFFSSKKHERGTGLGLSIAYGVVKQHRGFIGLDSRPGKGTSFWILFPTGTPAQTELAPPQQQSQASGLSPYHPSEPDRASILVVEDEDVVRELAVSALRSRGYRVHQAATATEAEQRFNDAVDEIQLVLTDLILKGSSGRYLADSLRVRKPELRVIYTSGYSVDQLPQHLGPEAGTEFLEKPFTLGELADKVAQVMAAD